MQVVQNEFEARALANAILDPGRRRPIVAVTTRAWRRVPEIDLEALVAEIADSADVYLVHTGEPTWELADHLPDRLQVFGGGFRLWWPGVAADSDPYDHPLFLVLHREDGERKVERLLELLRPASAHEQPERGQLPRPGEIVEGVVVGLTDDEVQVEVNGSRLCLRIDIADPRIAGVEIDDLVRARVVDADDGPALTLDEPEPDSERIERLEALVRGLRLEVRELESERRKLLEVRANQRDRIRQLEQARITEQLRQHEHSRRPERATSDLSLADEEGFCELVRQLFSSRYTADDRARWPLRSFRLHPSFLPSARSLKGISSDKLVEVSMHVIARRAHELPGLAVHQLKRGEGGAPQAIRGRDGAKGWRCALQRESAGARRLHWWELPDGSVELASVGHHDDFSIPE